MIDVLTERRGAALPPLRTITADSFTTWIEANEVRYVLVEHRLLAHNDRVRAVMQANPQVFHLLSELPRASLYQVRPRKD